jgi:TP901 family phage tail tape measure protein
MADARAEVQRGWGDVSAGLRASFSKGDYKGIGTRIGGDIVHGISSQFGMLGNVAGTIATALGPVGVAALGIGAAVVVAGMGIKSCVSEAASWETQMVGVKKVLGDISDSDFSRLSSELSDIQARTGMADVEITGAAAGAGRMGIDSSEIAEYTETILMMADAWDVPAESASNAIGKMGSVVKPTEMAWADFARSAGSAINDLADSMATSEASIVTGASKLGGTMSMLKPSPDQISSWYALVAQLQAFGMTAETSGESVKDAFAYMMRDEGDIAGLLDMDTSEFQAAIREDAIGTVQELAVAISELPIEEQGAALALFGSTGGQAMGMLAGKVDPITGEIEGLSGALATANSAWSEASSLEDSYAEKQGTLNAQMDIFGGKIDVIQRKIGGVLLPIFTDWMIKINETTNALINLGERGWGAITTIDEKMGAFGIDELYGYARDPTSAVEDAVGWGKEKLGDWFGIGEELGEDLAGGIDVGTEGLPDDLEETIAGVDAEGAGKESGEAWGKAFDDAIAAYVKSGMSREMAVMYGLGAGSDLEALNMYNAYTSTSKGHTLTTYGEVKVGDVNPMTATYRLTDSGNWQLKLVDAQGNEIGTQSMSAVLAGSMSPEEIVSQLISDFLSSSHRVAGPDAGLLVQNLSESEKIALEALKIDLGTIVELSGRVAVDEEFEILDPYETWGSPQHMADYFAEYADIAEAGGEGLLQRLYRVEQSLQTEGAAGWESAWANIFDPGATDQQVSVAIAALDLSDTQKLWVEKLREIYTDEDAAEAAKEALEAYQDAFEDAMSEGVIIDWDTAWEAMTEDAASAFADNLISGAEALDMLDLYDALEIAEKFEEMGGEAGRALWQGLYDALEARADYIASLPVGVEADPAKLKELQDDIVAATEAVQPLLIAAKLDILPPDLSELSRALWWEDYGEDAHDALGEYADDLEMLADAVDVATEHQGLLAEAFDVVTNQSGHSADTIDLAANALKQYTDVSDEAIDAIREVFDADKADALRNYGQEIDAINRGMSNFAKFQEDAANEMFFGSYIGPTSGYADFLAEEAGRGAFHAIPVELETTAAYEALETIRTDIRTPITIPVDIDLTASIDGLHETISEMIWAAIGENDRATTRG